MLLISIGFPASEWQMDTFHSKKKKVKKEEVAFKLSVNGLDIATQFPFYFFSFLQNEKFSYNY